MNPLLVTKETLAKMRNQRIKIVYQGVQVNGTLTKGYLASNSPNEPGSFDFEMDTTSKNNLKAKGIEILENFSMHQISEIDFE